MIRVYLRPGESPPRGLPVKIGPRGGRYVEYFPSDSDALRWRRRHHGTDSLSREEQLWVSVHRLHGVEARLAEVTNEIEEIVADLEFPSFLSREEVQERVARYDELDRMYKSLKKMVERARRQLYQELESESIDWLSEVISTEMLPEAVARIDSIGDLGMRAGIHAATTFVAETHPGVFPEDPLMHPTRVVHKVSLDPDSHFEESDSEIAMWALDRIFAFDVVPEVRYASVLGDGRSGHVMRWVDHSGDPGGTAVLAVDAPKQAVRSRRIRDDLIKMFVLDFLGMNEDRHLRNYIIDPAADRAFAIDSGYAFWRHHEESEESRPADFAVHYSISILDEITDEDEAAFRRMKDTVRRNQLKAAVAISQIFAHDPERRERLLTNFMTRTRKLLSIQSLSDAHDIIDLVRRYRSKES
jgi:hypothetical protein